MKNFKLKTKFTVPLFGAKVWVVVAKDMAAATKHPELIKVFGEPPEDLQYAAMCVHSGAFMGLIFSPDDIDTTIVAHEVFHLTHRILEWADAEIDRDNHEHGALLHGYLMKKVIGLVKPWFKHE